jgi:hypothetical protein
MLSRWVFSPQSELVQPNLYARSGSYILVVQTGEFNSDIPECYTLEMQKLDDVRSLEFQWSDTFQSFTIYVVFFLAISFREEPRFSYNS